MSRWTVLEDTERSFASEEVLGRRPSLISWWIVWRRRQSGLSLNAPARPTVRSYQLSRSKKESLVPGPWSLVGDRDYGLRTKDQGLGPRPAPTSTSKGFPWRSPPRRLSGRAR